MNTKLNNTASTRAWTWMVYLAGDNNLEDFSSQDLREMKRVGSTPKVALVAQVDRISDKGSRRYYLTGTGSLDGDVVEKIPETNCGDPKVLKDFINWAVQSYPARHYALIIWNHGSGWKEDDIYKAAGKSGGGRKPSRNTIRNAAGKSGGGKRLSRSTVRGMTSGKTSRALFSTTMEQLLPVAADRGIAYDDSDADFLDNAELKEALQFAVSVMGQKIDLLGLDACLMSMLEVVYQVREQCGVVVGSQETEPGDGWPYDLILSQLCKKDGMTAEKLGKVVVSSYISYYKKHYKDLPVTQSAIDVDQLGPLVDHVNVLSQALLAGLDDSAAVGKIFQALRFSQGFRDSDYKDLGDYCRLLHDLDPHGEIGKAAGDVLKIIKGNHSPVLASGIHGNIKKNATGLSIYMPGRIYSDFYNALDFAKKTKWDDFLSKLINPGG